MFKRTLIFCVLVFCVLSVRANGDPVAVHSAITLSPTPVAVHVPEVQLVDEHVTFVPDGLYTTVTVRYLLHNRSSRSFDSLPYGFPIDYWGSGPAKWTNLDDYSESEMEVGWRDGYIRNVSFTLGDRQLKWQCSKDTLLLPPQPYLSEAWFDTASEEGRREFDSIYAIYGDSLYSYTHEISRRWFYTYLDIPAGGFVTLEVRYSVECNLTQGLYARRDYMTNDVWYQRFQYDFTPASYWGDGHADRFNVELDVSGITPLDEKHFWMKDYNHWGDSLLSLPMQRGEDRWTYSTTHFDLAAAKPFVLVYNLKGPMPQPVDKLLNHRLHPDQYTVTVSGADKKYPAANLSDLDLSTATVLLPDNEDSLYITIRFKEPTAVAALLLLNGYTKDRDTWRNNARIDSLLVTAQIPGYYYWNYETNKVDTNIYKEDQHRMLFGQNEWIVKWTESRWLPDKYPHSEPNGYNFQSLIDNSLMLTLGNFWSSDLVTEIRLRISAAEKGLKYNDLCISEIILLQ